MKLLAAVAVASFVALSLAACDSKMEEKECDKIRGDAFELLNKAQHCNNDTDCRQSDWPGCQKPESEKTFETIKPMKEQFQKGKCEEPKSDCKPPPEVYCKQGLCTHREKGMKDGSDNTPTDQIQIQ